MKNMVIYIILFILLFPAKAVETSENLLKISYLLNNKDKIDSIIPKSFVTEIRNGLPFGYPESIIKKMLYNSDASYIQNYQKQFIIDSSRYLALEYIQLKDLNNKNINSNLLLFSKSYQKNWKVVNYISGFDALLTNSFVDNYFFAYEIIIKKLKEKDFIKKNIIKLYKAIYGKKIEQDEINSEIIEDIMNQVLDFYISDEVYYSNLKERGIYLSCYNMSKDYYFYFSFTLNWFNNWTLNDEQFRKIDN